jgi:hypothetical protein
MSGRMDNDTTPLSTLKLEGDSLRNKPVPNQSSYPTFASGTSRAGTSRAIVNADHLNITLSGGIAKGPKGEPDHQDV